MANVLCSHRKPCSFARNSGLWVIRVRHPYLPQRWVHRLFLPLHLAVHRHAVSPWATQLISCTPSLSATSTLKSTARASYFPASSIRTASHTLQTPAIVSIVIGIVSAINSITMSYSIFAVRFKRRSRHLNNEKYTKPWTLFGFTSRIKFEGCVCISKFCWEFTFYLEHIIGTSVYVEQCPAPYCEYDWMFHKSLSDTNASTATALNLAIFHSLTL
jgi:hypothetical protein